MLAGLDGFLAFTATGIPVFIKKIFNTQESGAQHNGGGPHGAATKVNR
jgi:hypothetical protein